MWANSVYCSLQGPRTRITYTSGQITAALAPRAWPLGCQNDLPTSGGVAEGVWSALWAPPWGGRRSAVGPGAACSAGLRTEHISPQVISRRNCCKEKN